MLQSAPLECPVPPPPSCCSRGGLADAQSQPLCPPLQTPSRTAVLYIFSSLKGCEGKATMGEEELHPPHLPKSAPGLAGAWCQPACGRGADGRTDALQGWSKQAAAAAQDGLKERKEKKKTNQKPAQNPNKPRKLWATDFVVTKGWGIVRGRTQTPAPTGR